MKTEESTTLTLTQEAIDEIERSFCEEDARQEQESNAVMPHSAIAENTSYRR
jgi:hypothetical protein